MTEQVSTIQGYSLLPSVIELTGRDRLKWLHSFVTNEIRNLNTESWQETFVTDNKGKSFSHGCVFISANQVYFLSVSSGQERELVAMWDRYIISEDVVLRDASQDWIWLYVADSNTTALLAIFNIDSHELQCSAGQIQWFSVPASSQSIVALSGFALTNDYVLFGIPRPLFDQHSSRVSLAAENVTRALAAQAFFPWFGIDFSKENLPQEVDRDSSAISFKKGCYLGQETIARLDALGQVQKKLIAVKATDSREIQTPGTINFQGSQGEAATQAGTLTSLYQPLSDEDRVGFAMIRRKFFNKIDELTTSEGLRLQPRSKSD
jgi:folate-binding protein YgfZ